MLNRLILFSIRNKFLIGLFTVALIVAGVWSMTRVPLDAVPDITNNQVQVITQAPNLGTEDIEQFVTYPVELAMSNLPGVSEIRSISRFGISLVTVVFDDDMGIYLPRQLVSEKLNEVREEIPEGFGQLSMGPIATGLGEIYQYTIKVDSSYRQAYSPTELRTIQDWIVRRQMAMVPGVVEVNSFGGRIKQYEVAVDPDVLQAMNLTLGEVFNALEKNNANTGGAYIEKNKTANFIRGEGLIRSLEDIENIAVKTVSGTPIRLKDVATVQYGSAVRYGAVTRNGEGEAVGGLIMMLTGANSNEVIGAVKDRMALIEKSLPEGLHIEPFLDRSVLIANTTNTVTTNLIEGALIVIFVLVFLLGNWRGGLIVASTIPLSLLFAFILMNVFDVWANLMSLGAIDFGIIVDGGVIIVEGTVFMLMQHLRAGHLAGKKERENIAYSAASRMMNSAFFGQLIILIVFLPILFLQGVEGKMFKPMALVFMFAMLGAIILCLTYVPMMSALFLKVNPDNRYNKTGKVYEWIQEKYERLLERVLRRGAILIISAVVLLGISAFAFTRMGGEFIPQLDEGDIAFHILLKPGSALTESIETSTRVEKMLLKDFPEIKQVISRFGVADVPTDPMPMDQADCFVILKPRNEWVSAKSKEELIEKINEKLSVVVGVGFEFSQPIEMRFNELITGVREDVAIKLYGDDLNLLAQKSSEIVNLVSGIRGVGDLKAEATSGLPQMTVNYNREELAQYGMQVEELNRMIEMSFAGARAGVVFEGEKRFDLVVRLDSAYRTGIEDLRNLPVATPLGSRVPLRELAEISYKSGPMQISRDNTNRRTYVGINVRGRDVKSLVAEIRTKLDAQLDLPPGYYIRYGGAFENLERATDRLYIVVPVSLALIFILIFFALKSFKQTLMIYVSIPLAVIGGVFSLWARDMHFSISAGIGFIVLFGIAVLNGLILISGWNELKRAGVTDLNTRIKEGAKNRIRPIMLTALTDILGFMPMALSTSAGAEVQRPLATVVIGGMMTATILTLFVLPVLYKWLEEGRFSFRARKPVIVAATVGMCLMLSQATAQQRDTVRGLTLHDAISRSLAAYPQLTIRELEIEQEEVRQKGVWNGGSTVIYSSGEEIRGKNGTYTPLAVRQEGMELFGAGARRKVRQSHIDIARSRKRLSQSDLIREVKSRYAAVVAAQMRLDDYHILDSLAAEVERAARLRFELEETSGLEYLAGENQLKQIGLQRAKAQYDLRIAQQNLNLLFFSDSFFVAAPFSEITELVVPAFRLEAHPEVVLAQQRVALAEEETKVAKANQMPTLNLEYGQQRIGDNFGFFQFSAGLAIPLLNMRERSNTKATAIQKQIASQELWLTREQLKGDYETALGNYLKWQSSWRFYQQEALPLANKQRKGAMISYQQGAIDYFTLTLHLKATIEIQLNGSDILLHYLLAQYELEYFLDTTEN